MKKVVVKERSNGTFFVESYKESYNGQAYHLETRSVVSTKEEALKFVEEEL